MIHPDAVLTSISPAVGLGLVAIRPLPKGTLIWVHDALDRILTPQAMASLPSQFAALKARFTYRNQNGYYVLAWDDARFMNHSCDYNCALTPFNFEIAVSDIAGGEQLTNDYAMLNLEEDERLKCRCGSPSCRGLIGPADQVRYEARWRREIQSALTCISQVKQVLGPLLAPESLAAARAHYANAGYPLERGALAGRIAAM